MTTSVHPLEEFALALGEAWCQEAAALRRRGLLEAAGLVESMAEDLEEAVWDWLEEAITLREAASLAHTAYSTIQSRIRVGDIPNAGEKGSPRVKRRDLPLKGSTQGRNRGLCTEGPAAPKGAGNMPGADLLNLRLADMG